MVLQKLDAVGKPSWSEMLDWLGWPSQLGWLGLLWVMRVVNVVELVRVVVRGQYVLDGWGGQNLLILHCILRKHFVLGSPELACRRIAKKEF